MKVTVIIPNYNGKHFLGPCLESLSRQTFKDFQTLVVDNASTDGSVEYLTERFPQVEVLTLRQNYGFCKAVNTGIRQAETPYVFLLNNDTTVNPDCIQKLSETMERSPRIFSAAGKMIQLHHPERIDSAGDLYTLPGWAIRRGLDRPSGGYNRAAPIFSACAGAAMYRRGIFERIGYFDENHVAYLEDVDIGYRAKIYGYQNVYCPAAVIRHVGSGTSGSRHNAFKVKISARNSVYLNYKNMPFFQLLLNLLPLCAGYAVKGFYFHRLGYGKDYLSGIREGLLTCGSQKKVPFRPAFLLNYIRIELELLLNTFFALGEWGGGFLSQIRKTG